MNTDFSSFDNPCCIRLWITSVRQSGDRVKAIVDRLVNARLLVRGQLEKTREPYVEPAHDFLVRGWGMLQDWINEEKANETLELQQRLTAQVNDWVRNNGPLLPDGERLDKLENLLKQTQNNWLNQQEKYFIQDSINYRDIQRKRDNELKTRSELANKTKRIQDLLPIQPLNGLLLTIEATGQNIDILPEDILGSIQSMLISTIQEAKECNQFMIEGQGSITAATINSSGRYIATGDGFTPRGVPGAKTINGTISIRNTRGEIVCTPIEENSGRIDHITFSSDDKYIALVDQKHIKIFNINGDLVKKESRFNRVNGTDTSITVDDNEIYFEKDVKVLSQDGRYLAKIENDLIKIWDNTQQNENGDHELISSFRGYEGSIVSIGFSHDNCHLIGVCSDKRIRWWEFNDNLSIVFNQPKRIVSIAFRPINSSLFFINQDGNLATESLDNEAPMQ